MRLVLITLILLSSFLSSAQGRDLSAFGVEKDSRDMKRIELQDWISTQVSKELEQFVEPELFKVYPKIEFKTFSNSTRRASDVNLTMLGIVSPILITDKPSPKQGVFDRVAKLNLTFVVSDRVSERTIEHMIQVARESIPAIDQARIETNVLKMDAPKWTIGSILADNRVTLSTLVVIAFTLLGLNYLMKGFRLQTSFKIAPVSHSNHQLTASSGAFTLMTPVEQILEQIPDRENILPLNTQNEHVLERTLESIEIRRLRSAALTLSLDECVAFIHSHKKWSAVFVNLLTPARIQQIMMRLSESDKKQLAEQTLEINIQEVVKNAVEILNLISRHKKEKMSDSQSFNRLVIYADQLGPDQAEKIYNELLTKKDYAQFAELVRRSLPVELLQFADSDTIKSIFLRLSQKQRLDLLASLPNQLVHKLLDYTCKNQIEKEKALDEVSNYKLKNRDNLILTGYSQFMRLLREAYGQNTEFQNLMRPHVENYIWAKTKGLEGQELKKSHRRHNVA